MFSKIFWWFGPENSCFPWYFSVPPGSFKQAGPAFAARCDVLRQQPHPAPVQAPPFPSSYFQDEVAAEANSAEALFTLDAHCGYATTHAHDQYNCEGPKHTLHSHLFTNCNLHVVIFSQMTIHPFNQSPTPLAKKKHTHKTCLWRMPFSLIILFCTIKNVVLAFQALSMHSRHLPFQYQRDPKLYGKRHIVHHFKQHPCSPRTSQNPPNLIQVCRALPHSVEVYLPCYCMFFFFFFWNRRNHCNGN